MYVRFSNFCPQCCTTRELFCCLLFWDETLQTESSILLIGDYAVAYDARLALYVEVQSQDIIIRHLVTSPLKLYFQIFWQKILSQNNRSYNREKSTEWTQIDLRNIQFYCGFLVSVVFVW